MSSLDKANSVAHEWVESMGGLEAIRHDHASDLSGLMQALDDAGLLAPEERVIRTPEELEALAREDAAANVLASKAGMVRTAGALWEVYRLGSMWGLPAVVIATGAQVRAAREAMEVVNE